MDLPYHEHGGVVVIEQHVGRLEIAVGKALPVHLRQPLAYPEEDRQQLA